MVKLAFNFAEAVPQLDQLAIVDVGAAPTKKPAFYQPLLEHGRARLIAFEPDRAACDRLNEVLKPPSRCYPYAIGRGGPAVLYETTFGYTSSLYRPNAAVLNRFSNLAPFCALKNAHSIETHRLDDVIEDSEIDLLKVDVQGAELDVLIGGDRLTRTALCAHLEVEFVQLYENQPLFADVDTHMRSLGFQLHTFNGGLTNYFYTPVSDTRQSLAGLNQVVYADAVYIRDLAAVAELPPSRVLKLIAALHDFYKSFDLCLHLLELMRDRGLGTAHDAYRRALQLPI